MTERGVPYSLPPDHSSMPELSVYTLSQSNTTKSQVTAPHHCALEKLDPSSKIFSSPGTLVARGWLWRKSRHLPCTYLYQRRPVDETWQVPPHLYTDLSTTRCALPPWKVVGKGSVQLSWHCSRTHGHQAPQRTGLAGHKLRALPSLDHSLPQLQGGTERYQVVDKLPLTTTTGHRHLSWSDRRPVTKCNPEVHATMLLKWLLIVCYW